MAKVLKICKICNTEYYAYPYEKIYCSGKCYFKSRLGKSWGGAVSTKGKKIGKYKQDRVNKMSIGKKEAHLARALEHLELLRLEEARSLLQEGYPTNFSQFIRALGYRKIEDKHRYAADAYCVLIEQEKLELCKLNIPFAIASLSLTQVRWFKNLLGNCSCWEDFNSRFLAEYKSLGVPRSVGKFIKLVQFVQATNFKTCALQRKELRKGYSTERKMREILQSLNLTFKEQVTLKDIKNNCNFRPDFIVEEKLIIEVNGDYWHGYGKKVEELKDKILARVLSDIKKYKFYEDSNFKYLIVWEHDLDKPILKNEILRSLESASNFRKPV